MDKDIHIGDTLILERCGDVIPDVKEVIPGKSRTPISFETCPVCDSDLEFNDTDLICTNPDCTGKHVRRLVDSVTRIGIERLGEPTIAKLVANGHSNLVDIFNLTREDVIKLERFGESSTKNLLNEIQNVKTRGVYKWQILASLNIPMVGKRMSKTILENMSLTELRNKTVEELDELKDVGFKTANSIYCGLIDNSDYIDELLQTLPIIGEKEKPMNEKGTICFTGKMPETRSYYGELAKAVGWEPVSSVTKDLSLLVCANANSTSGKAKKARKYGVNVIGIDDFLNTLED